MAGSSRSVSVYFPGGSGGGGEARSRGGGRTPVVKPHVRTTPKCKDCGVFHTVEQHEMHGGDPVKVRVSSKKKVAKKAKVAEKATGKSPGGARSTKKVPPAVLASAQDPTAAVAEAVLAVIQKVRRGGEAGRAYGRVGDKVFISALWRVLNKSLPSLTLNSFKRVLVDANRRRLLSLARADLVGAMDPGEVADSEIQHLNATFHFVLDPAGSSALPAGLGKPAHGVDTVPPTKPMPRALIGGSRPPAQQAKHGVDSVKPRQVIRPSMVTPPVYTRRVDERVLEEESKAIARSVAPAAAPAGAPSDTTAAVARAVWEVIPRVHEERGPSGLPRGRFYDKVFISAIWRALRNERLAFELTLDAFKKSLLDANRRGLLTLMRADLVGAMDPAEVAQSEISDRGATFHFVSSARPVATHGFR